MHRCFLYVATFLVALFVAGCGELDSKCGNDGVVEHESVPTRSQRLYISKSLCRVISWGYGSIGVYQVESLKTYVDEDPYHTHIELSLVDAWKPGSDPNPVIRAFGGPGPDCRGASSEDAEHFEDGETIVAFLRPKNEAVNEGYYLSTPEVVFHEIADGRFSNGGLFSQEGITLQDLRELVEENGFDPDAEDFCTNDVEPN